MFHVFTGAQTSKQVGASLFDANTCCRSQNVKLQGETGLDPGLAQMLYGETGPWFAQQKQKQTNNNTQNTTKE
jgi:hypothetical protein